MSLFKPAFAVFMMVTLAVIVWRFMATRRRPEPAPKIATAPAQLAPAPKPADAATPMAEPADHLAARLETMRALYALALGATVTAVAARAPHDEIVAAIRTTLAGVIDKPNYAPRRPLMLPKLVQAMNDDDVSRRELSAIIAGDPALAGNLLRLANSPFYRLSPAPIESLDRAVAVLGIEGMRSLISAALLQPVFRISGGSFAKFGDITWRHTLCAANAAEAHAAILENSDPFAAQLLALMMGLATVVVFRVATDEYLARQITADAGVLTHLIESQTAAVARSIAASWELSDRMSAALADQSASPQSSLGRSLQFGRYLGALAVLHERKIIDDDAVAAALKSAGPLEGAYQRIWGRLIAQPQDGT